MRKNLLTATMILAGLFILSGCGSLGSSDPTSGAIQNGISVSAASSNDRTLWGLWHCRMDPATGQIEVEQLRTAMFTANVNKLLEGKPGNLLIGNLDLSDFNSEGILKCTVTLKHPLPGLTQFNGFDVWGVFMHNGSTPLFYSNLVYSDGTGANEAVLLNPDGYTRWYNYSEFDGSGPAIFEYTPGKLSNLPNPTATLNPYKVFADSLNENEDYHDWITSGNTDNRGMFMAGQANSRRYEIKFPIIGGAPKVDFQYAVIATWEPGDPTLTGQPNQYEAGDFPTSANCEEAFLVSVSTIGSDLYYVDSTDFGGVFRAEVEVFDWQAGLIDGNTVSNEVNRLIFIGDVLAGGSYEFSQSELAMVANPSTDHSSVFSVEITDCTPTASGVAPIWVIVEAGGLNGATYGQGFPTQYPDPARRAAYLQGTVTVANTSGQLAPVVTEVIPASGEQGQIITGLQIIGSNFIAAGLKVEFDNGSFQIPVSNIALVSTTKITCDLDLNGAEIDLYDVTVTVNKYSGSGTLKGTLPNAFEVTKPPMKGYGWPNLGRTPQRNHLSPAKGPQSISQVYAKPCTAAIAPETLLIGVDPDNPGDWLVYIGYYSNTTTKFSAYRASDGSLKWSVDAPSPYTYLRLMAVAPPNVPCPNNESGTVYVWAYSGNSSIPESIIALSAKNGSTLWSYTAPGAGSWLRLERYGMVDANGDFLFCNSDWQAEGFYMRCLNRTDGSLKWVINTGGHQTPAIELSNDGNTAYVIASETLRAYNMTVTPPTVKWSLSLGSYLPASQQSDPIVASDGSLYIMSRTSNLVKISDNGSSGSVVWATPAYSSSSGAWIQLAEGSDGSIYSLVPTSSGITPCQIYRFNPANGAVMNQSLVITVEVYGGMAIGSDGLIYLGGRGSIWCFNPDLTAKWTFALPMSRHTDAALLEDGSLFVADIAGGILRKFKD